MNVAAGLDVLLNCPVFVLGLPAKMLHTPVPTVGVFAPRVMGVATQVVWAVPALLVVGEALTVRVLEFAVVNAVQPLAFVQFSCITREPEVIQVTVMALAVVVLLGETV